MTNSNEQNKNKENFKAVNTATKALNLATQTYEQVAIVHKKASHNSVKIILIFQEMDEIRTNVTTITRDINTLSKRIETLELALTSDNSTQKKSFFSYSKLIFLAIFKKTNVRILLLVCFIIALTFWAIKIFQSKKEKKTT